MQTHLIISACLVLGALAGCSPETPSHSDSPFTLTVLHINDHHSRLDEEQLTLALTDSSGKTQATQVQVGGFARVITAMQELGRDQQNVVRTHSGDAITGDLYYTLTKGQADADLMNLACFDAFTLGNHEFDAGDQGLRDFLDMLAKGSCPPAVLSANVRFGVTSPLHPDHAPEAIKPYTLVKRSGQTIGLVGVTIAQKTKTSSRPDPDTWFEDERTTVQAQIDQLTAQGINKIIVQSHMGYGRELDLAQALHGVDAIIGGDSHSLLGPQSLEAAGLHPVGPYPTITKNAQGDSVCVVQAWQHAYAVGELQINFDTQGRVTDCAGRPHVLIGDTLSRAAKVLTGSNRQAALEALKSNPAIRLTAPDPEALKVLSPYAQAKAAFSRQVVIQSDQILCLRRVPGTVIDPKRSAFGTVCDAQPHVIAHGGDMQKIVAQALLYQGRQYFKADISLLNGGAVRTDFPAGNMTGADIHTTSPFKNRLVQLTLYGYELKDALEDAIDTMLIGRRSGRYPYTAGLRWDVDLNAPKGQRIGHLEHQHPNGQFTHLVPGQLYNVITIDFLADKTTGYDTLGALPPERKLDVGLDYTQALLDYAQALHQNGESLKRPPTALYSTQGFTDLSVSKK